MYGIIRRNKTSNEFHMEGFPIWIDYIRNDHTKNFVPFLYKEQVHLIPSFHPLVSDTVTVTHSSDLSLALQAASVRFPTKLSHAGYSLTASTTHLLYLSTHVGDSSGGETHRRWSRPCHYCIPSTQVVILRYKQTPSYANFAPIYFYSALYPLYGILHLPDSNAISLSRRRCSVLRYVLCPIDHREKDTTGAYSVAMAAPPGYNLPWKEEYGTHIRGHTHIIYSHKPYATLF